VTRYINFCREEMKYQRSTIAFKKGTYKMTISELETITFAIIKKSLIFDEFV